MKVGALIEARSGSTRLPGKIYKPVQEKTSVLEMVVRRLEEADSLDEIIVSAPNNDWTLMEFCKDHRFECCMGTYDEIGDVMREDYRASSGWDIIVQITGDCPLVDPVMVDTVVKNILESEAYDFVGFIHTSGFEVRSFRRDSLKKALEAMEDYRRNGSTIFYRPHEWITKIIPCVCHDHLAPARARKYSVDTEDDLKWVQYLFKNLPWNCGMNDVFDFVMRLDRTSSGETGPSTSSPTQAPTTPGSLPGLRG